MRPGNLRGAIAVALAAVVLFAGCTGPADGGEGHRAGTTVRELDVAGVARTARVHAPRELADDPVLVVMLHGGFGSGRQAEAAYGWDAEADARGWVVAYPDGLDRTWNAGGCCGPAVRDDHDDDGFLTALVADLQAEYGIRPERTVATGMSNGALLAYRLACETDLVAAIGPVAGTIVSPCDAPRPIPVLHIHGALDAAVPIDGGVGSGPGLVHGLAVADAVAMFRAAGGCADPVVTEEPPVTTAASACPDGSTVTLVTIADAGHQWPGSVPREGAQDPPSTALDATALLAEFFAGA